jgi:2',3'-cyclic-nucleotide 2'-phosphodiesterase (5'-nucleotidase family)
MPRKDSANRATPIRTDTATRLTIIKAPMSRRGGLSPLGAFVADAYRNAVRADLAIVSQDELRADLPAGAITRDGAAAILEPGHQLKKISMAGADLQWVFENMVIGAEPCCQLSGAVVTFDPSRKDWERVKDVRQVLTKKRFDAKQTYTVVISDYLVTAGNSFPLGASSCSAPFGCARSGLLGRWAVEDAGTTLDAFMTYLRRLAPPVAAPEDVRIVAK